MRYGRAQRYLWGTAGLAGSRPTRTPMFQAPGPSVLGPNPAASGLFPNTGGLRGSPHVWQWERL